VQSAAHAIGLQIQVFNASNSREIDESFASLVREGPDALLMGVGPLFVSRRFQLTHLATRHALPAIYSQRQYTEVGGLMSYGPNLADAYRQMGVYAGRILKGSKPGDLPVVQLSKFELVINAQAARTLGLTVPDKLLTLADEVIE
jgi:putative ABC transport system substrate-binding protein